MCMRLPVLLTAGVLTLVPIASPVTADSGRLVGVSVSVSQGPWRIMGDDGHRRIVYTVGLTNLFPVPLIPEELWIEDQRGRTLSWLRGDDLRDALTTIYPGPAPGVIAPSQTLVAPLDMRAGPRSTAIRHRIEYKVPPGTELPETLRQTGVKWSVRSPEAPIRTHVPLSIAPPLRGNGWLNLNACCTDSPHSKARLSTGGTWQQMERFAIDFVQLRGGGQADGDGSRNSDYFAFGSPIMSATDGVVVRVRNNMPDIPPGAEGEDLTSAVQFLGNHVSVRIRAGVFAVYAHMKEGSVRVEQGDRVRTGQRLGRLGNSGNTTGPHLHFQLSDSPILFGGSALPYVFDRYRRMGDVTERDDVVSITGKATRQRNTYPLAIGAYHFR